jgi:hypothetical protein
MLKVAFGKQTLGRSVEEFLSGFSNYKSDVPLLKCTGTVTGLAV